MTRSSRARRPLALLAAAATGLSGLALLAPATSSASSHREAPYTSTDPEVDGTDVYAFVSPDDADTVTLIANYWPFEEPDGGPNFYKFYDGGNYDINIDNDGDAVADLTYRWVFSSAYRNGDTFLYNTGQVTSLDDADLNFRQTYDLQLVTEGAAPVTLLSDVPVAPSNVGPASMPDYASLRDDAVTNLAAGAGQVYAGQADDPFFLDLRVFDLLYGADLSEVGSIGAGDLDEAGNDTLNGRNVQTLALKVPSELLALNGNAEGNPVIGVWSTSSKASTRVLNADGTQTDSGDQVQVSRLGNPLVNEVVVPIKDKDRFNGSTPVNDAANFLEYVQDPEVPRLIEAIYGVPAPDSDPETDATEREDLVEVFLTGICTGDAGCPSGVPALEADLNSQLINEDVVATDFVASEQLRLNMAVPPTARPDRLGVIGGDFAGFPNGRRLSDDVIDIALRVVEGELLGQATGLGDGVDSNDLPFTGGFPYVALPSNSAVNSSQFTGLSRLAGADRFGTAAAIAKDTFATTDTVVLASGAEGNLPDALAGNYVAGLENAPILLTTRDTLPDVTARTIEELGASRVVVLGGPAAISQAQVDALDADYDVERIGGADRYETAALIAAEGPDTVPAVIVARGDVLADALVAGPLAYRAGLPVLLTPPTGPTAVTTAALEDLGVNEVIITGGPAAVSEAAEDDIAGTGDVGSVIRLAGDTRQATAVAIARYATGELGFDRTHVDLARGDATVDALAGGPHTGLRGGVILLTVGNDVLGSVTAEYLAQQSDTLEVGHVFGGPAAVSAEVLAAAVDAANANDPTADIAKR